MSRDAVAMNLKNLFAQRQASSEPVMRAFYVDKNYNVYPQFFLADGQGSVVSCACPQMAICTTPQRSQQQWLAHKWRSPTPLSVQRVPGITMEAVHPG